MRPGDPGSTSALGGALRGHALRLADLVVDLMPPARRGTDLTGRPRPADRATTTAPDDDGTQHERDLMAAVADELDRVGALLQQWTATTVEAQARVRRLDDQLRAAGLVVEGNRVTELPGPSRRDPVDRLRSREHLQELLNRVTAARSKELARLTRELDVSREALVRLSARARSADGR